MALLPAVRGEGARRADEGSWGIAKTAVIALLLIAFATTASACPVCYGETNSPLAKGTNNGVLFLLGIVGVVQIGFAALFYTFWKRAREFRKHKESFQLIEGGMR